MGNQGLWNLKKKNHGSFNFCSIVEKRNRITYMYLKYSFITNSRWGEPLSDVSLKKKKKKGDFNFFYCFTPPKIIFGMLFGKYIHFLTYWDHQLENKAVSIFSVIF